jgi:hypothetical protein
MEYIVNFAQKGKHFGLQFHVATLICVQVVKIIYTGQQSPPTYPMLPMPTIMWMEVLT